MDQVFDLSLWAVLGFILASYSVIGNDSIQTLWELSLQQMKKLIGNGNSLFGATIFSSIVIYCWYTTGGDIAYGRLGRIGYIEPEWYHVMTPAILTCFD